MRWWALAVTFSTALAGSTRAEYQSYSFTISGTITAVNDLSTYYDIGSLQPLFQIHLLPDVPVGGAFSASGSLYTDARGVIVSYSIYDGPPDFSAFGVGQLPAYGRIVDPTNLGLGFVLHVPGNEGTSYHRSVYPFLPGPDTFFGFDIYGGGPPSSFTQNLFLSSRHLSPKMMSVDGTITSIELVPVPVPVVPEPSSMALLALGSLGAGVGALCLRRPAAA